LKEYAAAILKQGIIMVATVRTSTLAELLLLYTEQARSRVLSIYIHSIALQDRQCTYKVTLRRVRVTVVAVEKK